MPGIYRRPCRYCGSEIAFADSATTGQPVALDPVPVPSASVARNVGYAVTTTGLARLVNDIHRPPATCYPRHRCPQESDAAARQDAEQMRVGESLGWWQDQIDAHVYPAAPESIPNEVRRLA